MPNDGKNSEQPAPGPGRVSVTEDFEIDYFGKQQGLSGNQVRDLIKQHGSDRERLEEAAKLLRGDQ